MSVVRGQRLRTLPHEQGGTIRQHHMDLLGHWVWGPLLLPLPLSPLSTLPPTEFTGKDMIVFIDLFSGLSIVLYPGIGPLPHVPLPSGGSSRMLVFYVHHLHVTWKIRRS